jgi:hypothetical protein
MSLNSVPPFLFPFPPPPPSTTVFPPLGSSYLPDDLASTAFSLFFPFVFGFPYLGLPASGDSLSSACCKSVTCPHHVKHPSPPPAAVFRSDRVRASLYFCQSSPRRFRCPSSTTGLFSRPHRNEFPPCSSLYGVSVHAIGLFPSISFSFYLVQLLFFFLYFVCYLLAIML